MQSTPHNVVSIIVLLLSLDPPNAQPFSSPRIRRGRRSSRTFFAAPSTRDGGGASASAAAAAAAARPASFFDDLSGRFRGDFDNYDQVLSDRRSGLVPREGGGHEHIHCTLVPIGTDVVGPYVAAGTGEARLAAFYFDGLPGRIFRFRLYALRPSGDGDGDGGGATCSMVLYSLEAGTEGRLRRLSGRPTEWVAELERHLKARRCGDGDGNGDGDGPAAAAPPFEKLRGCDVLWAPDPDPRRHAYAYGQPEGEGGLDPDDGIHAVMVNGEATVPSTMNPGSMIRVVDELSLWPDDFWINDRGFDPETGDFVYGNQRGVPYKMRRVSTLVGRGTEQRRTVTNDALAWTLGEDWRTEEEYERRMGAIGGVSARMNAPGKPS